MRIQDLKPRRPVVVTCQEHQCDHREGIGIVATPIQEPETFAGYWTGRMSGQKFEFATLGGTTLYLFDHEIRAIRPRKKFKCRAIATLAPTRRTPEKLGFTDEARELRRLMTGQFFRSEYPDYPSHLSKLRVALEEINTLIGGAGVEYVSGDPDDWNAGLGKGYYYVNQGDTYHMTIVYDERAGRFLATSWGDHQERIERRAAR